MAFEPKTWATGELITAEDLNRLEQAVDVADAAQSLTAEQLTALTTRTTAVEATEATAPGVTTAPPGPCWTEIDPDAPLIAFWQPGPYEKGTRVRDGGRIWTATSDVDGPRPSDYPGAWDLTS